MSRTGADSLLETAVAAGIELLLVNPGTTELALVDAIERAQGIRPVLGLFEGVLTGAADGYARMADKPALTLMHLGPSLGNGIANLHNARRARSPIVNIVGQHPTWHASVDSPLAMDIESLARPVSDWLRTSRSARRVAADLADAIHAARQPPGGVATLIIPADCQWDAVEGAAAPRLPDAAMKPRGSAIRAARTALQAGRGALLLGGRALRADALAAAGRIATATRCRLFGETFPARMERGPALPLLERFPYLPQRALATLRDVTCLVTVGVPPPVAFFASADTPGSLVPEGVRVVSLAESGTDLARALGALADELGAPPPSARGAAAVPAPVGSGLTARNALAAIATHQPDGAIVIDEGVSCAGMYLDVSAGAPAHSYLALTGGATGEGLPCAVGAALAHPQRKVIVIEGDGSAMYTVQALWTQARERLDVVNVIFANRAYQILRLESESRYGTLGARAARLTSLEDPQLDWLSIARGLGVAATRAASLDELHAALRRACAEPGPHLIEVLL
jgi:acetolactate synthase I/II/III large subunit